MRACVNGTHSSETEQELCAAAPMRLVRLLQQRLGWQADAASRARPKEGDRRTAAEAAAAISIQEMHAAWDPDGAELSSSSDGDSSDSDSDS